MYHPKREPFLPYLTKNLPEAKIIQDRGKGLWDTARRAWLSYDTNKEFHTVIQDDVLFCKGFKEKVETLLNEQGDKYVYAFFIRNKGQKNVDFDKAIKEGYLVLNKLGWCLGVTVPTKYIEEMIAYCDSSRFSDKRFRNRDDERLKMFFRKIGLEVYYPLPCWLQHNSDSDSLIGLGHNKGRKAAIFIDDECSTNIL
jgi:hypothetical protein